MPRASDWLGGALFALAFYILLLFCEASMNRADITPEILRGLLQYDAGTGALTWRERPVCMFQDGKYDAERRRKRWNTRYAGRPALASQSSGGYLGGYIFSKSYSAHRAAWAVHYGQWPQHQIDHINGNTSDNRIENLRDVPQAENARNKRMRHDNQSGCTGVYWHKPTRNWCARIGVNQKSRNLGYFAKKTDAIAARKAAEGKYGYHENHGNKIPV